MVEAIIELLDAGNGPRASFDLLGRMGGGRNAYVCGMCSDDPLAPSQSRREISTLTAVHISHTAAAAAITPVRIYATTSEARRWTSFPLSHSYLIEQKLFFFFFLSSSWGGHRWWPDARWPILLAPPFFLIFSLIHL